MGSELQELGSAAEALCLALAGHPDLSERAGRLAERLAGGQFNVSVVGEFKRGKSTLINALAGYDVMPTGVLPLTAVPTELGYGTPGAVVRGLDGQLEHIELGRLAEYVTEALNPSNKRGVARVQASVMSSLLRPGVVLVDTPGLGSIFGHDEVTARALLEADGAILVLSADAPLSEQERKVIEMLAERQAPTFYVLNRSDHLDAQELAEVAAFVSATIAESLGREQRLWCLSARAALVAELGGRPPGPQAGDFEDFVGDLKAFVDHDLVSARIATGRNELTRLANELNEALALEAAASELDIATLDTKVAHLREAVTAQRDGFEDERTLLHRDVAGLSGDIGQALEAFVAGQPRRYDERLAEVARSVPIGRLEDELRESVRAAVRESFDRFRKDEAARAEAQWAQLAERFRHRTGQRVNAVRAVASDLFDVSLPELEVPRVAEEREHYFYLFLHVGSSTENVERLLRRLLPPRVARRRLLDRARKELDEELDKHAGRARWDLSQRLTAVSRRFEAVMSDELSTAVEGILAAAQRAGELREMAGVELGRRRDQDGAARAAATAALELVGAGPGAQS